MRPPVLSEISNHARTETDLPRLSQKALCILVPFWIVCGQVGVFAARQIYGTLMEPVLTRLLEKE
jgi:hypothetical protein